MPTLAPAPVRRKSTVHRHPIPAAAVLGVMIGVAFLALSLSGAPILGWSLLAAVTVIALVDIVRTAAGRPAPGILERLLPRPPGGA